MIIIMITIIVHILTVACVPPKQTALPPHNESILCHICFFFNLQKRVSNGSCHIHHPGGPGGIPGRAGLGPKLAPRPVDLLVLFRHCDVTIQPDT